MRQHASVQVFLAAAVVILTGCSASHHSKGHHMGKVVSSMKDTVIIKPAGSYEECFILKKEEVMDFSFSSNEPINFNIHYHALEGIKYPVSETAVTRLNGVFDPLERGVNLDEQDAFCLMWENQEMTQLNISYVCSIRER